MERNKITRKRDARYSTRAIEVRLPRLLYEMVCDYKRICGFNAQKAIREILQEFFKDELRKKIREETNIEAGGLV